VTTVNVSKNTGELSCLVLPKVNVSLTQCNFTELVTGVSLVQSFDGQSVDDRLPTERFLQGTDVVSQYLISGRDIGSNIRMTHLEVATDV